MANPLRIPNKRKRPKEEEAETDWSIYTDKFRPVPEINRIQRETGK